MSIFEKAVMWKGDVIFPLYLRQACEYYAQLRLASLKDAKKDIQFRPHLTLKEYKDHLLAEAERYRSGRIHEDEMTNVLNKAHELRVANKSPFTF